MKTKPVPTLTPEQAAPVAPLASYVAEFEQWMRKSARCKGTEAEDICQEIRVASWELRDVPVTRDDARLVFLRLASRFECRARRQVYRQGALVQQPDELAEAIERDAVRSLALFNALQKLDEQERWLVKECKIEERSYAEVARQLGVTDNTVRNRLWRAMTKLIAICKDEEKQRGKDQKALGIIAPLAFEFTETQRAAFSAIWKAEGCVPAFGGGPPDPPGPPVIPAAPPIAAAPVVSAAVGSAVSAVTMAIVVVLLILFPTSIVAIFYFWDPPRSQTANKGLRAPPVSVVEDVVPMNFVPPRREQAPARIEVPPASSSSASVRSADASSSSPPIDPEELDRARNRRPSRFLPSP